MMVSFSDIADDSHRRYLYRKDIFAYWGLAIHDPAKTLSTEIDELLVDMPNMYRPTIEKWLAKRGFTVGKIIFQSNPIGGAVSEHFLLKPDIFIYGMQRCMSTALSVNLSLHPDIFLTHPKETKFFSAEYSLGFDYFSHVYCGDYNNEKVIVSGPAQDIVLPYALKRAHNYNPQAKAILGFRNPFDRIASNIIHLQHRHPQGTHPPAKRFTHILSEEIRNGFSLFHSEGEYVKNLNTYNSTYELNHIKHSLYYRAYESLKIAGFDDIIMYTVEDLPNSYPDILERIGLEATPWDNRRINGSKGDLKVAELGKEIEKYLKYNHNEVYEYIIFEVDQLSEIFYPTDLRRLWEI